METRAFHSYSYFRVIVTEAADCLQIHTQSVVLRAAQHCLVPVRCKGWVWTAPSAERRHRRHHRHHRHHRWAVA